MFLLKLLGLADIIAALAILFRNPSLFGLGPLLAIVLLFKGLFSLFADWSAFVYGVVDIIAAIMLFFSFAFFPLDVIVFLIMIYKGMFSMF